MTQNPMIAEQEQQKISQSLIQHFPDYSFLKRLESTDYPQYHIFNKTSARHCVLHTIDVEHASDEATEYYAKKLLQTTNVHHPNIFSCHDIHKEDDVLHVITEEHNFCELSRILDGSRLSLKRTLEVGIQICAALEYLHTNSLLHAELTTNDVLLDKHYFVKLSPAYFSRFIQVVHSNRKTSSDGETQGLEKVTKADDITGLGSIIFNMATGYKPEEVDKDSWEAFGLNPLLIPVIDQLINAKNLDRPPLINDVMDQLEKIQSSIYTDDEIGASCSEARKNRFKLTEKWTSMTPEEYDVASPATSSIFKERYDIQSCVLLDYAETIFEAKDKLWNNKSVWVHLFEKNEDPKWDQHFNEIANRLKTMAHVNISRTYSGEALDEKAYLATQCEKGERLLEFSKRHPMTPAELIDMAIQLVDALTYASKFGFYNYHLNAETIAVYKNKQGCYHYRILTPGYSSILQLTHRDEGNYLDSIKTSTALAPEIYENNPAKFQTTQYILGSILFQVSCDYHPCQSLNLEDTYKLNSAYCRYTLKEHRKDLPSSFQDFIDILLNPSPHKRFPNAKELKRNLDLTSLDFPCS